MGCKIQTYKTFRGDTFTINLVNVDTDMSNFSKATMTMRKSENDAVVNTTTKALDESITTLSFTPKEMEDISGSFLLDIELSDEERVNVQTLFVNRIIVEKDITR